MSKLNDGGPAYPRAGLDANENEALAQRGMSLRDWFAGQALMGLLAFPSDDNRQYDEADAADRAYCFADAMLAERAKGGDS